MGVAQAQCTVQVNGSNPGLVAFTYAPSSVTTGTLSVSCPSDTRKYRYTVRATPATGTLSSMNLVSGLNTLSASVLMPSGTMCSPTSWTGTYTVPNSFSSTQHNWQMPVCIRMNTSTPLPPQGVYTAAFTLLVFRCRITGSNCGTPQPLTPTVLVTPQVTVPLSCQVTSVPSLALSYVSGQAQPASAQGQACVVCNQGYQPSSIALTPDSAVQLGLRYTLNSSLSHAASSCGGGTAVQVQAVMPGGQWGRCSNAQCSSMAVHQIVVQH